MVSTAWYFAEGYTGGSFTTYLTIANPNAAIAHVTVTYFLGAASPDVRTYSVNATSRYTVNVNTVVGAGQNVSMSVNSDQPIVAERPMYFTYSSAALSQPVPGGSDVLGATTLGTSYDFGYLDTTTSHDTYLTILNQNSTAMTAQVQYFPAAGGAPIVRSHIINATSRGTIHVNAESGLPHAAYSALVTLSQPGLVERPFYEIDSVTGRTGSADVVGTTTPLTDWYFAEGYSSASFSERYILSNPTASSLSATVTFFEQSGHTVTATVSLLPGQQQIVDAGSVLGTNSVNNSAWVHASGPMLAERFMSFLYTGPVGTQRSSSIPGATDVLGTAAPTDVFYFAEGYTDGLFGEYLTIANPNTTNSAKVQVTFLPAGGASPTLATYTIAPATRFTLNTITVMPTQSFSMVVQSTMPIIAERPMYFSYGAGAQTGGTDVIGYQPTLNCAKSVQHVSGSISANTIWTSECTSAYVIDSYLDVPAGVTLTLAPGTVVKALGGDGTIYGATYSLSVEGTLQAVGTASAPITFTSLNDNSVGGATGNGTPAAADWSGIWMQNAGALDLEHAEVRYATDAVYGVNSVSAGSVTVRDSQFSDMSYTATQTVRAWAESVIQVEASMVTITNNSFDHVPAAVAADAPQLTLTGNSATNLTPQYGTPAYEANSSALDFAKLAGNTASGGVDGLLVSGAAVTSTDSDPLPLLLNPGISFGGALDVPTGVTLTLVPGTIVKVLGGEGTVYGADYSLSVEGTLQAVGMASAPITFTSLNDNSVGGATGNGAPAAGDWAGIWLQNAGALDLEHANVRYATDAIFGVNSVTAGTVTVRDSQFSDMTLQGAQVKGWDELVIEVQASAVTITNNSFDHVPAAVAASSPQLTLTTNTATNLTTKYGTPAYKADSSALNFAQLVGNTASGGIVGMQVGGTVMSATDSDPLPLLVTGAYSSPFLERPLDVPAGVTLTLAPGTVVKGWVGSDPNVTIEGELDAPGTSAAPIVFTSLNDNSVGGATGTGTPTPGDWGGIQVNSGGTLQFTSVDLSYANSGVTFSGVSALLSGVSIDSSQYALVVATGAVTIRGQLQQDAHGISACDWNTNCSVDAAYIDWGATGPFPSNSPPLVCGAVTVTPWVVSGSPVQPSFWAVGNCDQSDSPATRLQTAQDAFNATIASQQIQCSDGFQDVCKQIATEQACYSSAEQIAWSNVSVAGIPASPPDGSSVNDVVSTWLGTSENPVVSSLGDVLGFAGDIKQIVDLYDELASAYNTCA